MNKQKTLKSAVSGGIGFLIEGDPRVRNLLLKKA